jgi:hypothetical protein
MALQEETAGELEDDPNDRIYNIRIVGTDIKQES